MYNKFKIQLTEKLSQHFGTDQLNIILDKLDVVSYEYDFIQKERGLILYEDGIPEILKTFIACKKVEGMADGSLQNYFLILRKMFAFVQKPLDKIRTNDIRVFLYNHQQNNGLSNRTLDQYQTYLKTFFGWCVNEGYLENNITKNLKPIKYQRNERKPLTQLELEILRNVCETKRDRAIVEFIYSTGCRVSEMCGVKLSDINWSNNSVGIFGKGSKYRTSYLNAKAVYYLKEYLEVRKGNSEYLFVGERLPHEKLTKDAVDKKFRDLSKKANIGRKIHPHLLRHTTATESIKGGMPIEQVSKLLGHENISTTMIYAHSNMEDVQASHKKYII